MPNTAIYGNLPFAEASDYLRRKINMPSKQWTDLYGGMHSRAFAVAGAQKSEILCDFHTAVQDAIDNGTTIQDFRKQFDVIVEKHGWQYKGNRGWRTSVIYQTNLSTAYTAGREKQMQEPGVRNYYPYARYRSMDDAKVRPLHQEWNNLILPWTDPWWKTHTPPNGWGCRCWREPINEAQARQLGLSVSTQAPDDGSYTWKNPSTGQTQTIPNGVDPGWDYNIGTTTWGKQLSQQEMDAWAAQKADAWRTLTPKTYLDFGRPQDVPLDEPKAKLGPKVNSQNEMESLISATIGGEEKIWFVKVGETEIPLLINAKILAQHIELHRSEVVPFIPEALTNPYEIWASFEQHKGTDEVVLRTRIVKFLDLKRKGLLMVFNAVNGILTSWTMFGADIGYMNKQRRGTLLWGR